jgi:hypothetical protein
MVNKDVKVMTVFSVQQSCDQEYYHYSYIYFHNFNLKKNRIVHATAVMEDYSYDQIMEWD